MNLYRLRMRVLIPLSLAVAILLVSFAFIFYQSQQDHIVKDVMSKINSVQDLLILPQASKAITAERAEQWRAGFEALKIVCGEKALQATISLGVAVYANDGATAEEVIHRADQAMYRAKALGRNRVVVS